MPCKHNSISYNTKSYAGVTLLPQFKFVRKAIRNRIKLFNGKDLKFLCYVSFGGFVTFGAICYLSNGPFFKTTTTINPLARCSTVQPSYSVGLLLPSLLLNTMATAALFSFDGFAKPCPTPSTLLLTATSTGPSHALHVTSCFR